MSSNSDYATRCKAQINRLIEKKYAEPATSDDLTSDRTWYLPHFTVTNSHKPGRLLLVFDAAAITSGTCLNDELLDVPDLLLSLPEILWRIREKAVAMAADIEEMFLQVKIRSSDQAAQLFLWRDNDRTAPPTVYKMTSMIFGARSSPLSHSVRNANAAGYAASYPAVHQAITKSHYMDDYLESVDTTDEAEKLAQDVNLVHRAAGFNLRGWQTNISSDSDETARPLVNASDHSDTLGFNTAMPCVSSDVRDRHRPPSKREPLSAVMSLYDPLGLVTHYNISAKIILQQLWRENIGWDDAIPDDAANELKQWLSQLETMKTLRLPRYYLADSDVSAIFCTELHVFCDAIQQAYATAAYWRFELEDGSVVVRLAAARAKVAPLKLTTIPRFELQAAVIGCCLAATLQPEHRRNFTLQHV